MSTIYNSYAIRVRTMTESAWIMIDPILADGEPAYSSDANRWKIGDGTSKWSELLYVEGPVGPEGPIGPEGPAGEFANFKGSVATSESLPGSAEIGDAYLVTDPDPDEMWLYGGNGWQYAGVAGVPGPEGPRGPVGPTSNEVVVSTEQPTDPDVDFWVNPTGGVDTWGLLDARYYTQDRAVAKAGDIMTGTLKMADGALIEMLDEGRFRYDIPTQSFVLDDVSGETNLRKGLIIDVDPTRWDHATSKQYVDTTRQKAPENVNGVDMNTVKETGFYYGYNMTNSAWQTISTFVVIKYSGDWGQQTQYVHPNAGQAPKIYTRSWGGTGGVTWSPWEQVNNTSPGWANYTPTIGGCGVSTLVAKYSRSGDTIHVRVRMTITSVTGEVTVTPPVTMAPSSEAFEGRCEFIDVGGARFIGYPIVSGGKFYLRTQYLSGSYMYANPIHATSPFTWVSGDMISFAATYEAA